MNNKKDMPKKRITINLSEEAIKKLKEIAKKKKRSQSNMVEILIDEYEK